MYHLSNCEHVQFHCVDRSPLNVIDPHSGIGQGPRYGGKVDVDARWKEFLAFEATVVARYSKAPTMHG
ncbi:MAG: hypothetical protein ABI432_16320 [Flavobacteriales bacterium]